MNHEKDKDPLEDMRGDLEGSLGKERLLESRPEVDKLASLAEELRGIADSIDAASIYPETDEPLEKLIAETRIELEAAEKHKERAEKEKGEEEEGTLLTSEMLKREEDRLKEAVKKLEEIGGEIENNEE